MKFVLAMNLNAANNYAEHHKFHDSDWIYVESGASLNRIEGSDELHFVRYYTQNRNINSIMSVVSCLKAHLVGLRCIYDLTPAYKWMSMRGN